MSRPLELTVHTTLTEAVSYISFNSNLLYNRSYNRHVLLFSQHGGETSVMEERKGFKRSRPVSWAEHRFWFSKQRREKKH